MYKTILEHVDASAKRTIEPSISKMLKTWVPNLLLVGNEMMYGWAESSSTFATSLFLTWKLQLQNTILQDCYQRPIPLSPSATGLYICSMLQLSLWKFIEKMIWNIIRAGKNILATPSAEPS